ncbi:unnamed protein product [Clonostachys solani]|uniref:Nudix hydrolase domain-containing protein n=1 Tax=Clonostachys solani TaxID=160281 RepID=A0A9P0EI67_9HYPO|nr:unnamed protein product [Clonostachys solani]
MPSPPNKLLDLITPFDNVRLDFEQNFSPYYRFYLSPDDPRPHGFIHPNTVASMPWPPSVTIDHNAQSVTIASPPSPSPSTLAARTQHINRTIQQAIDSAIDADVFPHLRAQHSEPFLIPGARGPGPVHLERFAATLFGTATRGAHMTAFVRGFPRERGGLRVWVARRSAALATYPGMLDSTVAGGVKATDSPTACILAEASEEASLPPALVAAECRPAGVLTMANINPASSLYHSEILFVYDMEMPPDVLPTPGDDEVDRFELMGPDEVISRMEAGEFKPNVCPVMVDFFLRHGIVTPEEVGPGAYAEICSRLRRTLPVPLVPDQAE